MILFLHASRSWVLLLQMKAGTDIVSIGNNHMKKVIFLISQHNNYRSIVDTRDFPEYCHIWSIFKHIPLKKKQDNIRFGDWNIDMWNHI